MESLTFQVGVNHLPAPDSSPRVEGHLESTVGVIEPQNVDSETALPDPPTPPNTSLTRKVLGFLGIGRDALPARRSLVSMLWNLVWGFIQFIGIMIMLFLVSFKFKSPQNPAISEWDACDRPLGAWAALWLVRVVLASALAFWEYMRDRRLLSPSRSDAENANNSTPSAPVPESNQSQTAQAQQGAGAIDPLTLPFGHLYSRLTILSSLLTLIWFITGNILVYTSINTCRYAAPRLWWLNFAILCILYLMVLEVVVLGFVVLIIAPILFILWNIFLICIGRHPMQNPNMIKPEIGKLSKSIVDRIPLVIYIPPPEDLSKEMASFPHIYPPKPSKRQMRFRLLQSFAFMGPRSFKAQKSDKPTEDGGETKADSWADNWEQGQYPFVTLDGNRAACAICLSDFEAPPKRKVTNATEEKASDPGPDPDQNQDEEKVSPPVEAVVTPSSSDPAVVSQESNTGNESGPATLKLKDAGAGAQPLRLLGCAHAFHQTCIDPWLTDVSGRCPVCQRPVEPSKPHKSRRL